MFRGRFLRYITHLNQVSFCFDPFNNFDRGGIIAANIYRADDAPQYLRGNTVLLCLTFVNVAIYMSTRAYYRWRNRKRDAIWGSMTEAERVRYLATTKDEGNKRLDFRFAF